MNAVEYARSVSAAAVRSDPLGLERHVLATAPEFARQVTSLEHKYADRVRALHPRVLSELRSVDATAAAEASPTWRRTVGIIGATLAAGGAFAFFFSRASFDFDVIAPVAAGFVVAATGLYALAALPVRRAVPAPASVVVSGWIFVLATGAAAVVIGYGALDGTPAALPAAVVSLVAWIAMVAVVTANALSRARVPADRRAATSSLADEFRQRLRDEVLIQREAAVSEVRTAFDALPPSRRSALLEQSRSVAAVAGERGLRLPPPVHPPGAAILLDAIASEAAGIGVQGVRDIPLADAGAT